MNSILLFMASLSLGGCWTRPSFCGEYDCPSYTVVNSYENFEERLYDPSQWITTDVESTSDKHIEAGFWTLYHFMDRKNKKQMKIEMAKPVLVSINQISGQVSLSFFINSKTNLPEPNDNAISHKNVPAGTVYVRVFDGIAKDSDVFEHAKKLKQDLERAGKPFGGTWLCAAGYNPPWELINRHNEVWVYAV